MSRSNRDTSGGKAVSTNLSPRTRRVNSSLAVDSWRRGGGKTNTDPGFSTSTTGGNGGSGVVILRYPADNVLTVGAGLSYSQLNIVDGAFKYTTITAGAGVVIFA